MKEIGNLNGSAACKLVYLYLLANGDGIYNQKTMSRELGISGRVIRNAISQLRYLGLLTTEHEYKPRMSDGWGRLIYKINKNEIFSLTA